MNIKSPTAALLVWSMCLSLFPPANARPVASLNENNFVENTDDEHDTEDKGLRFRLSEGAEQVAPVIKDTVAPAARLSDAEANKILARLPVLKTETADTQDFKLRERSTPAPRAGATIDAAFDVPTLNVAPPVVSDANVPLEVARFQPTGEVALAPALSVTFSQPMVGVASQREASSIVPVQLSPEVRGSWRWLGTQTVVFQPDANKTEARVEGAPNEVNARLPMATNYRVTIPAGTKAAGGNVLNKAVSFTFATPPPTVVKSHPEGESNARDALMFLEFDQRIDANRIIGLLRLQNSNARLSNITARLRLATKEEIAGDDTVKELVRNAVPNRWLAFRAVSPNNETKEALPSDANVKIVVPVGTPSTEGARVTTREQSFAFKTFGALRVSETACGYEKRCLPLDTFRIQFNNRLDTESFDANKVVISPALPNAEITVTYNSITIEAAKRSNTIYAVRLDRNLKDTFGQRLTGDNQATFKVTNARPALFTTGENFTVLDPAGRKAFTVYSVNYRQMKVRLYKVTPDDWQGFRRYQNAGNKEREKIAPPGKLVFERTIDVRAKADELTETSLDLAPALTDGYGQVFIRVEPVERAEDKNRPINIYPYRRSRAEAWVQVTNIGLDAFADNTELVAWANSLKDGAPLAGVQVTIAPDNVTGATEANGLARLAFKEANLKETAKQSGLLVARKGNDVALLPESFYLHNNNTSWRRTTHYDDLSWYVFDDRKLYRPGEEVNIKGWLRTVGWRTTGDVDLFNAAGRSINYVLKDSQDNEIKKGAVKLNALGGFNLALSLPATMNLGDAELDFEFPDTDFTNEEHTHYLQVQEFRRPEFEVTARTSEAPHFVGESATATMTASYFAGGGLADTEVEWNVRARPTNYTPPNRDDYTFGKFIAWWRDDDDDDETTEREFKSRTDAAGRHSLRIDFEAVNPARPSSVTAEAKIQDVNRQTFAATTNLLVHPADVYVGVRSNRTFVQADEAFEIESIVTDLDGRAVANRDVALRLVRLDYVFEKGEWKRKETDAQEQTIRSAGDGVKTRFSTKQGGEYRLTARVRDGRGRANESELSLWVAGGKLPPEREVKQEEIELIPNRKTYAGGEVAEILVQSPFAPAEGVMTLRRSGLLRTERFTMNENSYTLRVPLEEAMTPNVHLQVDLVGAALRVDDAGNVQSDLPKRPAFASGEIKLEIPPVTRRLNVKASPRATTLEPGAETIVDVEVKDANGRSVEGTDTALVVVDESVLALTNYKLEDPLSVFYAERDEDTSDYHLREKVELASAEDVRMLAGDVVGGGGGGGRGTSRGRGKLPIAGGVITTRQITELANLQTGTTETVEVSASSVSMSVDEASGNTPIQLRQNFNALAVFAASFPTDKNGRANIKVKLPDNLTRYRVMAVSVAGGKLFGTGEAAITARQPLMVRPSAPRFLNFGDTAELPVIVQNQTGEPVRVNVAVRASNADLTEGAGRGVTVPANDRVEVRFPVAAIKPGTARFQIVAASNAKSDAAEISLPVYTPATMEAFATYGTIDEGAIRQAVKAPADAVKTFGGLEITLASTQLQELTDAVIYLYRYPYECSEQLASRIISIVSLKDVLAAFKTKDLPDANAMRASVNGDLQRLAGLQNEDGGFDFWQRGRTSNPFVSVHVAHSLARAKAAGFIVSPEMMKESQGYLKNIESKIPKTYSLESRHAIIAYALYVRALTGDRDAARARKLIAEAGGVEKLSLESLGWLLSVLANDKSSSLQIENIRRHLNNRVTETAEAAHFADGYTDGEYTILHSDRRADGVLLDALIGDQPQSDLIPKLVRGLLGNRTRGRWTNTQENVFILLALNRYFQTYERATPDFTARVWLGEAHAGEQTFQGRTAERQRFNLPMTQLIERTAKGAENLIIGKQGTGRLYFRIGTTYAPANLKLDAADYGFQIERIYEAVDEKTDVSRDSDGTWRVKAGARVRVRVKLINPARRYHVALVDNLPAGFESLNPALATTERLPDKSTETTIARGGGGITDYYWLWRGTWYEHQNLRDERAEAFTSLLWEGVHEYSYFIRATTPGVFVVPPAKAEEMYSPETFGRGASDRVRVE